VCGRVLNGFVDGRRLLDVLAAMDDAVGGSRVDTSEIDVGVDGAEDEAEEAEHEHGDHAARYQRLASQVRLASARCHFHRRIDFRWP